MMGDYTIQPGKQTLVWEKWFAWKPVRVHGKLTWLKTVYRTHDYNYEYGGRWVKKYGTLFDVIQTAGKSVDECPPWSG